MRYLLIFALLAGCSGGNGSGEDEPDCALEDRVGTYLVTVEELSGTCGEIPSAITRITDPVGLDDGCYLTAADWLSSDECRLERSFRCDGEYVAEYDGYWEQLDDNADRMVARFTARLYERGELITPDGVQVSPGEFVCSGTYQATYQRQ